MTSVSTRFFGQPRLTNPIFKIMGIRAGRELLSGYHHAVRSGTSPG
jgi:hypothetical protein